MVKLKGGFYVISEVWVHLQDGDINISKHCGSAAPLALGSQSEAWSNHCPLWTSQAADQIKRLYDLFLKVDATQVEVNPFGETPEGQGTLCVCVCVSSHLLTLHTRRWDYNHMFYREHVIIITTIPAFLTCWHFLVRSSARMLHADECWRLLMVDNKLKATICDQLLMRNYWIIP